MQKRTARSLYPRKSSQDDLAAAKKLINDCGYQRRDQELADAKGAMLSSQPASVSRLIFQPARATDNSPAFQRWGDVAGRNESRQGRQKPFRYHNDFFRP